MRVTVIGAAGTIGLACTHMAIRAGHEVRAFVRSRPTFMRRSAEARVEIMEGDILDRGAAAAAMDGADAAIHCVEFPPNQMARSWDALRHALEGLPPAGQFIYPGNVWVYGPPQTERVGPDHPKYTTSRLGSLKADLEKAVLAEAGTVIHLPEVYGPGVERGTTHEMFRRAVLGRTIRYPGDLDRLHEFIYIGDAARALIAPLGRATARGLDFTAPGYRPITPREFVSQICRAIGVSPRIRSVPLRWMRALALVHPQRRESRDLSYLYECSTLLDGVRIRRQLGWTPEVDYAEGIRRTLKWLRGRDLNATRFPGPAPDRPSDPPGARRRSRGESTPE